MIQIGENMNQQPDEPPVQLSSTYPLAPMDYVNLYTNENIKTGKAPLPPPIIKDTYTCFGKTIDPNDVLIRSLDQQGIQRLYKTVSPDLVAAPSATPSAASSSQVNINTHKKELKKLNHSILIAYLDLLEILVKAPNTQLPLDQQQIDLNSQQQTFKTLRDQKLEDIELLFINMHHLINELRPHQARDNIRCVLEMQKKQRLETANKFKKHLFKIVDLLKICINSIKSNSPANNNENCETIRSSKFLDELNNLISNANHLTKTLDKQIEKNTTNKKGLDANTNSKQVNQSVGDTDIDMEHGSMNGASDNNNNTESSSENGPKVKLLSNNKKQPQADNCDFKDVILCNLIDEFLLKENEF